MTQIELDDIVKDKLTKYKELEGIKTYSDAVNMLLSHKDTLGLTTELLRIAQENQQLLRDNQNILEKELNTK